MLVKVNGTPRNCPAGCTLAQLVADLRLDHTAVVAEVSGAIVPRDRYAGTMLQEHDSVELVRFVGGG